MSRNWWIIIGGGIIALASCACVFLFVIFAADSNGETTTASSNEPDQDAVQVHHQIGQDVFVGDVRWKVLAAEDLGTELKSDNQFIDPLSTSGRFIRVRVEIENRSTDPRTFAEGDIEDSQGRTFNNSSDATMFIEDNERCILEGLNPNLPRVCTNIYEVAVDATGLVLVVGDLVPLFGDEARISLEQ